MSDRYSKTKKPKELLYIFVTDVHFKLYLKWPFITNKSTTRDFHWKISTASQAHVDQPWKGPAVCCPSQVLWGHKVFALLSRWYHTSGWSHDNDVVVPAPWDIHQEVITGAQTWQAWADTASSSHIVNEICINYHTVNTKKGTKRSQVSEPLKNVLVSGFSGEKHSKSEQLFGRESPRT